MINNTFIFWIASTIFICGILFLLGYLVILIINRRKTAIPVACAGSAHHYYPKECEKTRTFLKNLAKKSRIKNYKHMQPYLIMGNSMQYANIVNDSIVLAEDTSGILHEDDLPRVVVLQRADASSEECQYKLRRAWKVINSNMSLEDYTNSVNDVLASPEFHELRDRIKDKCPSDAELMESATAQFNERISMDLGKTFILSTTYRTEMGKVDFSIHKTSSLAGIARYAASPINTSA